MSPLPDSVSKPVAHHLGTWRLADLPAADAMRVLNCAADRGVDHLDTAYVYGGGAMERIIGKSGHRFHVVTKVPAQRMTSANRQLLPADAAIAYPKGEIRRFAHESASRLGAASLRGVLLHNWSAQWDGHDPDFVSELCALKAEGLCATVGVSLPTGCPPPFPTSAIWRLDSIQVAFRDLALWRESFVEIPKHLEVQVRSVFDGGAALRGLDASLQKVYSRRLQLACTFGSVLVVGATSCEQLRLNILAIGRHHVE